MQGLNAFLRAALRMAIRRHERFTPAVRAGYLAPYDRWAHRRAIQQFVLDIPMSPGHPSYDTLAQIESALQKLADKPVLLAWGMRDWCFTPHFLARFEEIFPHAIVHKFADAGHWVIEDAIDQVIPLVEDFLRQHPLAREAART